jgi:hypothetical protein
MAKAGDKPTRTWRRREVFIGGSPVSFMEDLEPGEKRPALKKRRVVHRSQGDRIQIKREQLFPEGIPPIEKLANSDLVALFVREFTKDKTGQPIPHPKSILRELGRIPRKK